MKLDKFKLQLTRKINFVIEPSVTEKDALFLTKRDFVIQKKKTLCYQYNPRTPNIEHMKELIDLYLSSRERNLTCLSEIFPPRIASEPQGLSYIFEDQLLYIHGESLVEELKKSGYKEFNQIKQKMKGRK